jgi:hypothetical protein
MPVPHDPLVPIRKLEIGELRDKGVRLRLQRLGKHPSEAPEERVSAALTPIPL